MPSLPPFLSCLLILSCIFGETFAQTYYRRNRSRTSRIVAGIVVGVLVLLLLCILLARRRRRGRILPGGTSLPGPGLQSWKRPLGGGPAQNPAQFGGGDYNPNVPPPPQAYNAGAPQGKWNAPPSGYQPPYSPSNNTFAQGSGNNPINEPPPYQERPQQQTGNQVQYPPPAGPPPGHPNESTQPQPFIGGFRPNSQG